jgi:hypothetical protein
MYLLQIFIKISMNKKNNFGMGNSKRKLCQRTINKGSRILKSCTSIGS